MKIYVIKQGYPGERVLAVYTEENIHTLRRYCDCKIQTWEEVDGNYVCTNTAKSELAWIKMQGRTLRINTQNKRKYTKDGITYYMGRSDYCTQISVDNEDAPHKITIWICDDDIYDDVLSGDISMHDVIADIIKNDTPICIDDYGDNYANFAHIEIY